MGSGSPSALFSSLLGTEASDVTARTLGALLPSLHTQERKDSWSCHRAGRAETTGKGPGGRPCVAVLCISPYPA